MLKCSVLASDGWGSGSVVATEDKLHRHIFICFHVHIFIYVCPRCQRQNVVSFKHCFIKDGVSFLKVQALFHYLCKTLEVILISCAEWVFTPDLKIAVQEPVYVPELRVLASVRYVGMMDSAALTQHFTLLIIQGRLGGDGEGTTAPRWNSRGGGRWRNGGVEAKEEG